MNKLSHTTTGKNKALIVLTSPILATPLVQRINLKAKNHFKPLIALNQRLDASIQKFTPNASEPVSGQPDAKNMPSLELWPKGLTHKGDL